MEKDTVTFISLSPGHQIALPGGKYAKFDRGSYSTDKPREIECLTKDKYFGGTITLDRYNRMLERARIIRMNGSVDGLGKMPSMDHHFEVE